MGLTDLDWRFEQEKWTVMVVKAWQASQVGIVLGWLKRRRGVVAILEHHYLVMDEVSRIVACWSSSWQLQMWIRHVASGQLEALIPETTVALLVALVV